MLKLRNVSKRFGDRQALQSLSLDVPAGKIYGLLGPNGAGKTTTIELICNLLRPDSGDIAIDGIPVSEATKALVGIAPQENLLYSCLTCEENLRFFARLYGIPQRHRRDRVRACLAAVGLLDRAASRIETLSGGMKRRINIAAAIVHDPKVVILDEPTTGLDVEARFELWSTIAALRDRGTTLLLTTHLLEEAEALCDRIGILKQGNLVAEGTPQELKRVIPAAAILTLHSPDEPGAIARAQSLGFACHRYGNALSFWLPEPMSLPQVLGLFDGIAIDSMAIQPVRLEHAYIQLTGQAN